ARPGAGASGRQPTSPAASGADTAGTTQPAGGGDDTPSSYDDDADDTGVTHQDLLARELGAKVIGEYDAS
ncbi:MAG: hypothetical protein ACRDWY_03045, partial [Actinomycetes bacterium]